MTPNYVEGFFRGEGVVQPFRVFDTELSKGVTQQIFKGTTYPIIPHVQDIRVILDVGANIGAATVFFAAAYPEAKIYAVEPSSRSFDLLEYNTQRFENIKIFDCGLSSKNARVRLYSGKQDSVESSLVKSMRVTEESEWILIQNAASFVEEHDIQKIDILKVDTEGYELGIFRSLSRYLNQIKIIYVEYHSENARKEIDSLLPHHVLWTAKVEQVHRGEFCYLRRDLVPQVVATPELIEF